jgi:hypothetical protein
MSVVGNIFGRRPSDPAHQSEEQDDGHGIQPAAHALTDEVIAGLEKRRRDLIDHLLASPDGRDLVREADPHIHAVGLDLAKDIRALGLAAQHDTDGEAENDGGYLKQRSAAIVLNELSLLCHEQATNDLYSSRSKLYILAQKTHSWMDSMMDHRIRSRRSVQSIPGRRHLVTHWGWVSNLFTILATGALLSFTAYWAAAALIAMRITVTALVWLIASYPGDDSPTKPVLDSDPRICVLGHGSDLFLFASFGLALILGDHPSAGFLVMAAGSIMILGTIMRIGASATGFPVPRLHLERMVRGGSTLAAIVLAALTPEAWWWSAAVIIVLPTVFAFIETQEALRAFALGRRGFGIPRPPASGQIMELRPSQFVSG